MADDLTDVLDEYERRQRRRDRLAAWRLEAARWLRLPWRCEACGCLVSARRINRHAKFHHTINLLAWNAGGGRGSKPRRPKAPANYGGPS